MRSKLGRSITIIGAGAVALGLLGVWLLEHHAQPVGRTAVRLSAGGAA